MRKAIKAALIILITLVLVFFSAIALALYSSVKQKSYSPDDSIVQAFIFSKNANKKQCLSKYWDIYKNCSDESCYAKSDQFVEMCFTFSRGKKEELCKSNSNFDEKYTSLMKKVNFCGTLGIDPPHCERMHGILANSCKG